MAINERARVGKAVSAAGAPPRHKVISAKLGTNRRLMRGGRTGIFSVADSNITTRAAVLCLSKCSSQQSSDLQLPLEHLSWSQWNFLGIKTPFVLV